LLWEHAVLDSEEPILGVIWDGIGYGNDGAMWGGEFFVYKDGEFDRCFAFDYFNYLLGDKMSKEPRIAALALCSQAGVYPDFLKKKFSVHEWSLYTKMLSTDRLPNSSSMGRVFDAIASILDMCDSSSFEGEAAMLLENVAQEYLDLKVEWVSEPYDFEIAVNGKISYAPIIHQVLKDREEGVELGMIALRFHITLVEIVAEVARKSSCQTVGFSGGVFQNGLLVDLLIRELGAGYRLLFHEQLSPNDENISLGQMAWYYIKNNYSLIKTKNHVFGDSR
jgi:hydrogenase maturation protein HypF